MARSGRERRGQHSIPRHHLARFANDDGRLTVVRLAPRPKVLRRQAPVTVGRHRRLYSWQRPDGSWNDDIETGPLDRLDSMGSEEIDAAIHASIESDALSHMRILDWSPERRAPLQLFLASLLVRTPEFRERVDGQALPTLIQQISENVERSLADGEMEPEMAAFLQQTLATPGAVTLRSSPGRHQRLLMPLMTAVAERLHVDTLIAVRRFPKPMLLTGAQPVVLFPSHRVLDGMTSGRFFSEGSPLRVWDQHDDLLTAVHDRLRELAGIVIALDPQTLLVMWTPDTSAGNKLVFVLSQVEDSAVAGAVNLIVTSGSSWVGGRDDCEFLGLLVSSAERATSS